MRTELLLLFLLVGAGNYLMRALPLLWALRRKTAPDGDERPDRGTRLSRLLPFVGPSVVAALLVTSVLPPTGAPDYARELLKTGLALIPTLIVAVRYGNLGLTVLVGAVSYGAISALT